MWKKNFVPFFEAKVGGATYTRINTVAIFLHPLEILRVYNVHYLKLLLIFL